MRGIGRLRPVAVLVGLIAIASAAASSLTPAAADEYSIAALAFHPKSNALVLARGDGELRLVDFSDPAKPVVRGFGAKIGAAAFLSDGSGIVTGGEDGALRVWSLGGADAGAPIHAGKEPIIGVAVSARGRFLAAVDRNLALRIWQASDTGFRLAREIQLVRKFGSPGDTSRGDGRVPGVVWAESADVAFAPDESMVAVITSFNNVYVSRIDGRAITVPRGSGDYESCCGVRILFTADGRFMIARRGAQPGYSAFVWTVRAGRLAGGREFPGLTQPREFAALPSGAELLVADGAGLRRVTAGTMVGADLLPAGPEEERFQHVAVSADGARIATAELERIRKQDLPREVLVPVYEYRRSLVYRSRTGERLGQITLR